MKKLIILAFVFCFINSYGQINEQKIKSKISKVTAYLYGAEITMNGEVTLNQGKNILIFEQLSPELDPKSIRFTTNENVSILGISTSSNFLVAQTEIPVIKALKDSLSLLVQKLQSLQDEKNAFEIEKDLLLKNMQLGGNNTNLTANEIKLTADFYRARIMEVNKKISELNFENSKLETNKIRITNELDEINKKSNYIRKSIVIAVSSPSNINTPVSIQYLVNKAGWSPSYDIKATDVNKPIDLIYMGKVYNNTSIDWTDVELTLSTADPSKSLEMPSLKPWYLNYYNVGYRDKMNNNAGYSQNAYVTQEEIKFEDNIIVNDNSVIEPGSFSDVVVPDLNAEFEIQGKYTIPADDQPYLVNIANYNLSATYQHFAITKMDKDVFLAASITGWQDLNLVEGPSNIYYAGTFIGQSYVYTRNVKDTLNLSLGRDNKVLVTRTKLKDYSDKQLIGSKITETHSFEMVAKNNRKTAVDITLFDQYPISQTDEIEVKLIEWSNADVILTTGELKWKLHLEPGEVKKIKLTYTIKYPKNKPITIQQTKNMKMRMF